jgi:hypothetical protein
MLIKGIYADEWQKFHPDQFVNVWWFAHYDGRKLEFYCDGRAADVPLMLGGEDLEDFVLEPVTDLGETMTVADAIARKNELETEETQCE